MYRGSAGIDQINNLMQNLINPVEKEELTFEAPACQYRQGDRVIHLVNDAESNVFNGDLGYISDLPDGSCGTGDGGSGFGCLGGFSWGHDLAVGLFLLRCEAPANI